MIELPIWLVCSLVLVPVLFGLLQMLDVFHHWRSSDV